MSSPGPGSLRGVGAALGLPAMARALAPDEVATVELSLRGVLEARAAIDEALAAGAAVRLVVVGPVALAPAEIERLMPGTRPAQVEDALGLVVRWSESAPRFTADLSSAWALLTPWTTPSDLRQVSDAIRRLRLAPWVGRAIASRLALTPRSPLFDAARARGLLETAELGEDTPVPWRFDDEVTAAAVLAFTDPARFDDAHALESLDAALDAIAGVARGKQRRRLAFVPVPAAANDERRRDDQVQRIDLRGDLARVDRRLAAAAIASARTAATAGVREIVIGGDAPLRAWFLEDLVALCRNLGAARVTVESSETTLADPDLPSRLAAAGLTGVIAALPGDARATSIASAFAAAGVELELRIDLDGGHEDELVERFRRATSLSERVTRVEVRCAPGIDVGRATTAIVAAVGVARDGSVSLRMDRRASLPPCVFSDPAAISELFELSGSSAARAEGSHERARACAACAANHACPGVARTLAATVAPRTRALTAEDARGLVPLPEAEAHYENELESRMRYTDVDGNARERRVLRVNFHCNQACAFCFVDRELAAPDAAEIFARIDDAARHDAELALSGGEPTLNPRLLDYLAHARASGVRDLEIQTNAIKMADRAYADALAGAGLGRAFVSLHGITAEVSDRVTSAPGTFRRTIQGIQNLVAAGVHVRLNFVMCAANHAEFGSLPAFVDRELRSAGPGAVDLVFSFVAPSTDLVPRDARLIPRFREVADSLARGYREGVRLGFVMAGFESQCGVPPCFLPEEIRVRNFAVDLPAEELALARRGFVKDAACSSCAFERRCFGVRAAYAEMYGTGELAPISAST